MSIVQWLELGVVLFHVREMEPSTMCETCTEFECTTHRSADVSMTSSSLSADSPPFKSSFPPLQRPSSCPPRGSSIIRIETNNSVNKKESKSTPAPVTSEVVRSTKGHVVLQCRRCKHNGHTSNICRSVTDKEGRYLCIGYFRKEIMCRNATDNPNEVCLKCRRRK